MKKSKQVLTKIDLVSVIKVSFLATAVAGLLVFVVAALALISAGKADDVWGLFVNLLIQVVVAPLATGIACFFYNLIAKHYGGIEFEVADNIPEPVFPSNT